MVNMELYSEIIVKLLFQTISCAGKPNAGNLMIRPNERTHKMLNDWLAYGLVAGKNMTFRSDVHDQAGLHDLIDKAWKACTDLKTCTGERHYTAASWL